MSETERTVSPETARLMAAAVINSNFQTDLLGCIDPARVKNLKFQDEKFALSNSEAEQVARAVLHAHIEGNPTLSQVAENLAESQEAGR
jgi:hypothetical protein